MPVLNNFMGKPIENFDPEVGLTNPGGVAYRLRDGGGWGDNTVDTTMASGLAGLAQDPRRGELEALIIGFWDQYGNYTDEVVSAGEIRDRLVAMSGELTSLRGIFFGDISYDENEVSWIENANLGPLIRAFPNLVEFGARGGSGLAFSGLEHDALRRFQVQSGGTSGTCLRQIAQGRMPNLERLEIWLGSSEYGFDGSFSDIEPLILGRSYPELDYPFPKLKYLGLRNAEIADEIAERLTGAPVLDVIEELDLSMGLLSDRGVKALLDNPDLHKLKRLDVSQSWIGDEDLLEQLQALPLEVNVHAQRGEGDDDDDWRYVAVGE